MTLAELHEIVTAIYRAGWESALRGEPFNPLGRDRKALDRVLSYFEGQDSGSGEIGPQNQFK